MEEKKCSSCLHWCRSKWNSETKSFTDTVARCLHKGKFVTAGESCDEWRDYTVPGAAPSYKGFAVARATAPAPAAKAPMKRVLQEIKLKPWQEAAIERFKDKSEAPIFFWAGLGKTLTAIKIVEHQYRTGLIDSALIIAPNGVHKQWASAEIPKWISVANFTQCFGGRGGKSEIKEPPLYLSDALQILVVNVETFSTQDKWKKVVQWVKGKKVYIILDEATCIKNSKSLRGRRILSCFNIRRFTPGNTRHVIENRPYSKGRAVLTGTPITNNIVDIWSIMEFIRPNYWKRNLFAFQNRYQMSYKVWTSDGVHPVPITREIWEGVKKAPSYKEASEDYGVTEDSYRVIKKQERFVGSFKHEDEIWERLHEDAAFAEMAEAGDIPEQIFTRRIVPMGKDQAKAYEELETDFITSIGDQECTVGTKLVLYTRLQQCSSGFVPVTQKYKEGEDIDYTLQEIHWFDEVPKLEALYRDVETSEKPCIIITRFTAEAQKIYMDLTDQKYNVSLQTGWSKVGSIEAFQAGEYDVMVANIAVISKGFNLQNSHTMLYYSNTFSLENRIQSEGRIWRLGQTKPCIYLDYASENTIDMKVVAALRQRRDLLEYIRNVNVKNFLNEWDPIFDEEYRDEYAAVRVV